MLLRPFLIACFVCFTAGFSWAQATRPALSMTVSPAGVISLSLGERHIADGHWGLAPPSQVVSTPLLMTPPDAPVSTTVISDGPEHAVVTDSYANLRATYDLAVDGEDFHSGMHLENLDKAKTLLKITFNGMFFHFSRVPDGVLHAWHSSYLDGNGTTIFHPSTQTPLGVSFAHDDKFGISMFSSSEFDRLSLFNAQWYANLSIPPNCEPCFFTTRQLQPGKSLDCDVTFRVSTDSSITHLVEKYKKLYDQHFPALLYKPLNGALAQFAAVDKSYITRANPLGFGGANRRLDSDSGTRIYIRSVAPYLARGHAKGIIFWSPGGWDPPMYPPDFDQFPPVVQQNIPTLVAGFKKYGLRVGLCARCADGVTREPGKEPVMYRLSADDPEQMKTLTDRFHHAMEMGFDIFYLDSMGGTNPNDQEILEKVRAAVGPEVVLYTEQSTDMSLPYAGHYCEWTKNGLGGLNADGITTIRYLCPDSTWLCIDRTNSRRIPAAFTRLNLVPLVGDDSAETLIESLPTFR